MEYYTMDISFYNNGHKNIDINYDDEKSNANYKRLNSQFAIC